MGQITALKWIQQNMAAFEGYPNNLTICGFSAGGVSMHSILTTPMARHLFGKAIVESGGSRDSVLTGRPMSKDGVDPNYPVSAETIGIQFAHSMGSRERIRPRLRNFAPSVPNSLLAARPRNLAAAFSLMRPR